MSQYDIYRAANQRLEALIDVNPGHETGLRAVQARASARLKVMAAFLEYLGNPHRAAPVIHVGGTSGKGSTASSVASILHASGMSTVLHTSPFLQVSTEKLQIDGQLIEAPLFAELTDQVIDAAGRFGQIRLTYGEAWMAIVALAMARLKPDVAVIEVGAGGRFDLTNVVDSSVAVITTIGIDHTETLGPTIPEIAWHKAGIIKHGQSVVHGVEQTEARAEIDRQAAAVGVASLTRIDFADLQVDQGNDGHATWRDPVTGGRLRAGIPGLPQAQNGALAVAACRAFAPDLALADIERGLAETRIAARFERMPGERAVILDGAHNVQKVGAIIPDLTRLPRPRVGVIGFLAAKRSDEMIGLLGPALDHVVVARPDVLGKSGRDVAQTAESVRAHVAAPVISASSPADAVRMAEGIAGDHGSVIVTGSLYLCGAIRERWYASPEIIEQKTQWPGSYPRPS